MVSFQCDACQDVVKKPKLDNHYYRCHSSFTCVDCSTTFNGPKDWKGHTQCISEAQKYQKSLYKEKGKGKKAKESAQDKSEKTEDTGAEVDADATKASTKTDEAVVENTDPAKDVVKGDEPNPDVPQDESKVADETTVQVTEEVRKRRKRSRRSLAKTAEDKVPEPADNTEKVAENKLEEGDEKIGRKRRERKRKPESAADGDNTERRKRPKQSPKEKEANKIPVEKEEADKIPAEDGVKSAAAETEIKKKRRRRRRKAPTANVGPEVVEGEKKVDDNEKPNEETKKADSKQSEAKAEKSGEVGETKEVADNTVTDKKRKRDEVEDVTTTETTTAKNGASEDVTKKSKKNKAKKAKADASS